MSTTNTDFLPNTTGLNLGSPDQRWDGFFDSISATVINGSIIGTGADSVQIIATSQAVGFAGSLNTLILADGTAGITLTLPSAVGYSGQVMKIKKTDATVGLVTVSGAIDHQSSYVLSNRDQYVNLEAGNGTWQVVGNN